MSDLAVAAEGANQAASAAASRMAAAVWVTHGVACAPSNIAFTNVEAARRAAREALKQLTAELAAAKQPTVDEQAS